MNHEIELLEAFVEHCWDLCHCDKGACLATATRIGIAQHEGRFTAVVNLCDAHFKNGDYLERYAFPYAEAFRASVKRLVELERPPWWFEELPTDSPREPLDLQDIRHILACPACGLRRQKS